MPITLSERRGEVQGTPRVGQEWRWGVETRSWKNRDAPA